MNVPNLNRSRPNRRWFAAATVLIATTFAMLFAEVALRVVGISPLESEYERCKVVVLDDELTSAAEWENPDLKIFRPDEELGYTHLPGRFKVTLQDGFEFTMQHGEDTLRLSRPAGTEFENDDLPEVWVFGCSFTHGWSVNDDETFPWQLQELMPGHKVTNYGVGGYDQVHALIQLKQALASKKPPSLVVVAYAHFHDERNTLGHAYRKYTVANISPFLQKSGFPYARLGEDYSVVIHRRRATFWGLPLLYASAVANSADHLLECVDEHLTRRHDVSKALILEFNRVCQEHGVNLVVAGITQEPATWDMMAFCLRQGIHQVDISFDYGNPIYMNAPHDPEHPSPAGHRVFALRLADYLSGSQFTAKLNKAESRQTTSTYNSRKKESGRRVRSASQFDISQRGTVPNVDVASVLHRSTHGADLSE